MKIQIFVRSFPVSGDTSTLQYAFDYHYVWEGQDHHYMYDKSISRSWSKGRFFEKESAELMSALAAVPEIANTEFYDTGNFRHTLQAWLHGVKRIPCVIIDGQKFYSARDAITSLRQTQRM